MSAKTKAKKGKPSNPSNTVRVEGDPGKSKEANLATIALSGIVDNALTAATFSKGMLGELDLTECVGVLTEKANAVHRGDLRGAERLLTAQAATLNAIK